MDQQPPPPPSHSTSPHSQQHQMKVKVYYSFRGGSTTRLAAFYLSTADKVSNGFVPVPLKRCLWSIFSSSPDMICQEHDLSVYTANFQETCTALNDKQQGLIWEGQGLLSWIIDGPDSSPSAGDKTIQGKHVDAKVHGGDDHIQVHIELQPTFKWGKDEFYNALRNQDFDCFRNAPRSPRPLSACSCGINATLQQRQQQQPRPASAAMLHFNNSPSSRDSTLLSTDSSSSSPFRPRSSFDADHFNQKRDLSSSPSPPAPILPPPNTNNITSSTQLFRPEPIFPGNDISRPFKRSRMLSPPPPIMQQHEETNDPYRRRVATADGAFPDRSGVAGAYYTTSQQQHGSPHYRSSDPVTPPPGIAATTAVSIHHDPIMTHQHPERRSAFTRTNTTAIVKKEAMDVAQGPYHHQHYPPTAAPTTSSIPVIYTPSNKKRKKNHDGDHLRNNAKNPPSMTQQVSTAVRTYYDVERDANGNYALPVEIDSWTVVDLGTIVYDRPAYHNQRYIYPVNYTVRKWYRSMVDAKSDTQYTCRILDNGSEPKFEVTADDCPVTYSGPTPTTVWTIIVRRAFAIRNQEYGHNPVGPDFFGLRKNTIAKMIQDLPNAEKCSQYVWQTFEPARFNKPGRNRRRTDPMALLGGVNYSLTSTRSLFPHAHHAVGDYPRDPQPPPEPSPHTGVSMRLHLEQQRRDKQQREAALALSPPQQQQHPSTSPPSPSSPLSSPPESRPTTTANAAPLLPSPTSLINYHTPSTSSTSAIKTA